MPNDLNFCLNGIVWPDRTLHPAVHGELKFLSFCVTKVLYKMVSDHNCDYYLTSHEVWLFSEVKYLYQPIKVSFKEGTIKV